MKRIYKCIFELLLGITIVALCIFVFNFSLLGMESYIFHYPQWLLGHCLAVLFVLCIFLLLLITINYATSHDLRLSIKKATKFISLITLIIFAYIAIIGIDYDLLFHKTKKYPAYPSYVKVKGEYTVGTVPTVYPNNDIYWEEIKDINKETVLGSSQISHDAKMAYKGTFMFSDNEETEKLLDELTTISKDDQINAFRFFLLNRILASSDGALMELCDEYAYSYMKRNINYVLNYIAHNDTICQLYVNCISAELYFEELNIEDFERTVSPKVNENNRAMYKTFLQKVREKRVF